MFTIPLYRLSVSANLRRHGYGIAIRRLSSGDIRTRYCSSNNLISGLLCRSLSSLLPIAKHPMPFTPPQPPPVWNHSAEEILKLTKEAIEHDRAIQDKVGSLDAKDCTFESVSCNVV